MNNSNKVIIEVTHVKDLDGESTTSATVDTTVDLSGTIFDVANLYTALLAAAQDVLDKADKADPNAVLEGRPSPSDMVRLLIETAEIATAEVE